MLKIKPKILTGDADVADDNFHKSVVVIKNTGIRLKITILLKMLLKMTLLRKKMSL